MVKKICVVGTHGTGKTTLTLDLASFYKKKGHNVGLIQEITRKCPFPINDNMTNDTAMWIFHAHCVAELEKSRDHSVIISDRSVIDSVIYAKYFGLSISRSIERYAVSLMRYYDIIIFITPDYDEKIISDGVRSEDEEFQKHIHEEFEYFFSQHPLKPLTLTSKECREREKIYHFIEKKENECKEILESASFKKFIEDTLSDAINISY